MKRLLHLLLFPLQWLATTLLALVILFEEWGWEPLQALLARIGRWPGFRWIEARITQLPPHWALAVLLLPSLLLLPVKLLALWAISRGHGVLGALVIVAAKLGGTAVVARLFTLTRPALMRMPWFARNYGRWTVWKEALLARVRASAPWRAVQAAKLWLKGRWQALRQAWGRLMGGDGHDAG
jgi:hypothetical protein